jgi:CubicO group peptidase (beta-lactamase class C family)
MKTISCLFLGLFSCQSFTQGPLSPKGYTAAGFESLLQIFQENFTQYGEEGAALVVYHQGEKIVDLQGGSDGYGAPFTSQSDGLWFSATKGIASLALARLHSQGLLDYDQRVAYYWPDFAQGGKENITVRQLLSHQAGLVLLPFPLKQEDFFQSHRLEEALSTAEPLWVPGQKHGYHAGTIGLYMNALHRRIDPQGRTIGAVIAQEWRPHLTGSFSIGTPETQPPGVAKTKLLNHFLALFNTHKMPPGMKEVVMDFSSLFFKSISLGGETDPNKSAFWAYEQPSGNGIGSTQAVAEIYQAFLSGAPLIGINRQTREVLFAPNPDPLGGSLD